MADIDVTTTGENDEAFTFDVTVSEAGGSSRHVVTLQRKDFDALGDRYSEPEDYIRFAFGFLLERESKDSILARFDVRDISTYFPEFGRGQSHPRS